MKPSKLAPPLSHLQSATATEPTELTNVFLKLAETLDCKLPPTDFEEFISIVKTFEETTKQLAAAEKNALPSEIAGLRDYELAALIACGNAIMSPTKATTVHHVREKMKEALFTPLATTLGIASLVRKGIAETFEEPDERYGGTDSMVRIAPNGWEFLQENAEKLELRLNDSPLPKPSSPPPNDDIPF